MSDNSKLAWVAAGAALAGASVAVAAMKLTEKKDKQHDPYMQNPIRMGTPSFIDLPEESERADVSFPHQHEEKMRRRIAARTAVEEENVVPRDSVTVRVPATSANMGPGCKCMYRMHCI